MPNGISQHSPLIIGHRGASALAPENTLSAFKLALEDGAAGVELDVRLAGDGVPVVIHDSTLRRTGLCEGVVARMTSAELGEIDVGNWFYGKHPKLERTEDSRQVIPTLDQVFNFFKQRPTNSEIVYVEMKTDQAEDTYIDLAESVAQLVNAHQLHSRVVVVSFHLKALARMKTIDASITTGALFEPRRNPVKTMRKHPMITAALECGAKQILIHRLIATRPLLALAAENNLLPVVWTVDSRKWMSRTADFGIHALITNNPGLMTTGI
ncbi:MAG: glycerophosphoryl diester phosphodiesterase [Blastocatellia bacterium]|nr:glycerophosphoryl diester phosphodiesterase [Blastocatellia bacterium]